MTTTSINNKTTDINPFPPYTTCSSYNKLPKTNPTIWDYIKNKTAHQTHPPFNPYGVKPKPTPNIPKNHPIFLNSQKKINQYPTQQEGINHLPPSNALKLGFLNINGLYTSNEDRMLEVLEFKSQHNIGIFGLAETNINWNNGETYKKQQRKLRRLTNDKKAQLITSDTNLPWDRQFKPGVQH